VAACKGSEGILDDLPQVSRIASSDIAMRLLLNFAQRSPRGVAVGFVGQGFKSFIQARAGLHAHRREFDALGAARISGESARFFQFGNGAFWIQR
jgi:hypothetical protein